MTSHILVIWVNSLVLQMTRFIFRLNLSRDKQKAECGIKGVKNRFDNNLLTLNTKKLKFICFGKKITFHKILIKLQCLDEIVVARRYPCKLVNIKYLGMFFEERTKWEIDVSHLNIMIRKSTNKFKHLRPFVPLKIL